MRFVVLISVLAACGPSNRNGGDDTPGDSLVPICDDGTHQCGGSVYQVCVNGQWSIQEECQVACDAQLGCVNCVPGTSVCEDGNVHSCDASGNVGGETEQCMGANICEAGACVDACASAAENKSYIGCEYMAVDLDNAIEVMDVQGGIQCGAPGIKNVTMQACGNAASTAVAGACDPGGGCPTNFTCKAMNVCVLDAQSSPFGIVVSNPQARPVSITVTGPNGEIITKTVAAGVVETIKPNVSPNTIPDQSNEGTGKAKKAYKITSDLPIVAYQFNPLDNVNVFSNDASLLLPTTAYDTEYYASTWPTLNRRVPAAGNKDNYHGYISIVAHQANTVIEVNSKAAVLAGTNQAALPANTPTQFTLQPFEVLTLQAVADGDLSGTKITAVGSVPFGVFGGHEAMFAADYAAPDATHTRPCCADHIEEMLFPTSTWGKTFAITRSKSRGANEPDVLRIMAQKPNTTITFDPTPALGSCGTLQPGESCEVQVQGDTGITASEPILVSHYLLSAIWSDPLFGGSVGEGDPSFSIAVPVEQFRTSYTVLVPNAYTKNFLSIAAPGQGAVIVDGLVVAMTPYAGGLYRAARMQVNAGQHVISCPNGCGVEVMGYSDSVSYMFAGGLDLKKIVLN